MESKASPGTADRAPSAVLGLLPYSRISRSASLFSGDGTFLEAHESASNPGDPYDLNPHSHDPTC